MSTMKAARIHAYGGPEVLVVEEAPMPAPGPDEVLVRVMASSINPFDAALRAGFMAPYFNHTLPLVIGTDFAGTVEAVGSDVSSFRAGDRVYGRGGVSRNGSQAEFVSVPESDVATMPASLDARQAAALPHAILTAWQALIVLAELQAGQTVLIHGAAGGVGHLAAQLAKTRGAHVIGTTSRHADLLHDLGVDQVVDYSTTPFEAAVKDVDVVLDTVGGETQERSWKVLRPNGILVATVQTPSPETAAAHGVRQGMVYTNPPIGATLAEVATLADQGRLRPHVSMTLPLDQIADGHRLIGTRHTAGKIVIDVA